MSNTVDLVVNVTSRATEAVSGADQVGDAYSKMARRVDDAGAASEKAGRRLNVSAEGADNLASKSGQATGALGALSAGFELVGLEKYAVGLQSASMATDFFSGVGDSLNLIMESQALASAKAKVAMIAQGVVSRTTAAAQWVLNAAMSANPIGLVVIAVIALVAAFVIAYKRSERFREIVQAVGRAGRAAIGWVVTKIGELVRWVKTYAPAAWQVLQTKATSAMRFVTSPVRLLVTIVAGAVGWVRDKLPGAFETAKTKAGDIADKLLAPFRALGDLISDIKDAIGSIHLPKIPGLSKLSSIVGRVAGRTSLVEPTTTLMSARSSLIAPLSLAPSTGGYGGGAQAAAPVQITIQGALDPAAVARQIQRVLGRNNVRMGGAA